MGMVVVAFLAANAACPSVTTIRSTFKRSRSVASSGALKFLIRKSVLDGDILSLNPSKLAQLLPERLHEHRHTRSSARIQETYVRNFSCLLRFSECTYGEKEKRDYREEFFIHGSSCPPCIRNGYATKRR